jgi:hypothetical protein
MNQYFYDVLYSTLVDRENRGWLIEYFWDKVFLFYEEKKWTQHFYFLGDYTDSFYQTFPGYTFSCVKEVFSNGVDPEIIRYHLFFSDGVDHHHFDFTFDRDYNELMFDKNNHFYKFTEHFTGMLHSDGGLDVC